MGQLDPLPDNPGSRHIHNTESLTDSEEKNQSGRVKEIGKEKIEHSDRERKRERNMRASVRI